MCTYIVSPLHTYAAKIHDSVWAKSTVNLKQERNLYLALGGSWEITS